MHGNPVQPVDVIRKVCVCVRGGGGGGGGGVGGCVWVCVFMFYVKCESLKQYL